MNEQAEPLPETIVQVEEGVCRNCKRDVKRIGSIGLWWHPHTGMTPCRWSDISKAGE